jgi:hypothetical protein
VLVVVAATALVKQQASLGVGGNRDGKGRLKRDSLKLVPSNENSRKCQANANRRRNVESLKEKCHDVS